jgi:hypothetical protein
VLQDLYVKINYRVDIPNLTYVFHHQLKKLNIESTQIDIPCVFWVFEVCAHVTEELRMTCSEYFPGVGRSPVLLITLSTLAGTNLRSLRLVGNGLNFLAHPNSSLAQAIRQLPSLQHLHVSRCLPFHTAAFFILPTSLHYLFLSEYRDSVDDGCLRYVFVAALSVCVAQATGVIKMMATHGVTTLSELFSLRLR